MKSEEKESATIEKYVKEIKSFCEWLCGRPVAKEAVIEWKERLQKQEYVPVTVNGKLSALNGFFSFMGWTEIRVKFLRIQRRMFRERSKEQSP
ncbi:MAG: site-specific integrase [Lachnospiraceae bacterium]|nr:site-specific integrase [Lachnospiraceae bacterium]